MKSDYDALAARLAEVEKERDQLRGSRRVHELDNHHNALACAYCAGPLKDALSAAEAALAAEKESVQYWRDLFYKRDGEYKLFAEQLEDCGKRLVGEHDAHMQCHRDLDAERSRAGEMRKALEKIAAFNDRTACKYLAETGSYSSFDEPEIARAALSRETPGGA